MRTLWRVALWRLALWRVALVLLAATPGAPLLAQISPGPLAKAHAKLEGPTKCVECHGLRKEPMSQRCLACHKEVAWLIERGRGVHAKSRNVPAKECASCHPDHAGSDFELIDWGREGLAGFDHRRAGWVLDGKHAKAKCVACHTTAFRTSPAAALSPRVSGAGWMGLETACASCHERDDVHRNSLGAQCEKCHDAADWKKPVLFDHAKSDYPLTGKHADVSCDKCHKSPRFNLRPDAKGRVVGRYKPLPFADCSSCHTDPHKGRLTAACSSCHTTRGFRELDRKDFDHKATRYPLNGKHVGVSCESCHGVGLTKKTPAFARCADCHPDAHYGRATLAGQVVDCAACHRVEGFAPSTYTAAQHGGTAYPLKGRHAEVRCALCHVASDTTLRTGTRRVMRRVSLRPVATSCSSCHAEAHQGALARSEGRGECAGCHDERAWSPSSYTLARHARLALPLEGAHAPLACARCHVPVRPVSPLASNGRALTATVPLRIDAGCASCHVDPHLGRYDTGRPGATVDGCRACHDARRFVPATLAASRHAAYGFALDGAHRAIPCQDCHKQFGARSGGGALRGTTPAAHLAFSLAPRAACASCHADPHEGQFASRPQRGACESCHETDRWVGAARFVHDRDSSFPLAGAHSRVPCAACHIAAAQSGGGTRVRYRPLPLACEGCHADGKGKRP